VSRTTTIAVALALAAPLTAANSALGDAMRCSNAYHPFGPTVQREYQLISNDVGNSSYRESFLDFAGDSFIHQIDYAEGGSLQARVSCAGDGSLSVAPTGMTLDGEVIPMFSGALLELSLPPEAEWQAGKTWTHQMEFGAGLPVGMGVATMANEIVGSETVTVPAGTFECESSASMTILPISRSDAACLARQRTCS
jgi:hypothetical protein